MPPSTSTIGPLSKQVTIVMGLTIVGFMAFGLALSFYRNILFEETLNDLADQNTQLSQRIDKGYNDVAYVRSEQYKDKFAKENLNLVNPGETVLILTKPPELQQDNALDQLLDAERREAAYFEIVRQMPVFEHWKLYLFQRDRLEDLKKNL